MPKNILRSVAFMFLILILSGCGSNAKEQQQTPTADQTQKKEYLTPSPQGTPLAQANMNLSNQLMNQKDVLGTSIYEKLGVIYGDITFKSNVDKAYAHDLIANLLTVMKSNYPGKAITTQALSEGNPFDSLSFKP